MLDTIQVWRNLAVCHGVKILQENNLVIFIFPCAIDMLDKAISKAQGYRSRCKNESLTQEFSEYTYRENIESTELNQSQASGLAHRKCSICLDLYESNPLMASTTNFIDLDITKEYIATYEQEE